MSSSPKSKIKCLETENVVCPHCGAFDANSDDGSPSTFDGIEIKCETCGKKFDVFVKYSYTYSTYKIDEDELSETND